MIGCRLGVDFRKEIRWLLMLKKSECDREKFVVDAFGNF